MAQKIALMSRGALEHQLVDQYILKTSHNVFDCERCRSQVWVLNDDTVCGGYADSISRDVPHRYVPIGKNYYDG